MTISTKHNNLERFAIAEHTNEQPMDLFKKEHYFQARDIGKRLFPNVRQSRATFKRKKVNLAGTESTSAEHFNSWRNHESNNVPTIERALFDFNFNTRKTKPSEHDKITQAGRLRAERIDV
jgi:hypothetical protein